MNEWQDPGFDNRNIIKVNDMFLHVGYDDAFIQKLSNQNLLDLEDEETQGSRTYVAMEQDLQNRESIVPRSVYSAGGMLEAIRIFNSNHGYHYWLSCGDKQVGLPKLGKSSSKCIHLFCISKNIMEGQISGK